LIRPEVVAELLREHRARQEDAVAAERQVAQLRKREAALTHKQATMEEAVAAVDFTADDLAQAIEAVIGNGSDADLSRLARMLDVRVDLVERADGRSIMVTGRIRVPEMNASYGA
jgi:hypothetical protein